MQLMTGVSAFLYWVTNFFWDMFVYIIFTEVPILLEIEFGSEKGVFSGNIGKYFHVLYVAIRDNFLD